MKLFIFVKLLLVFAWTLLPLTAMAQTIEWSQQFGSFESDEALAVATDASGIYAAGFTGGILPDLDKLGRNDAFIRKFSANGSVLWTRQFGTEYDDEARAILAVGGAIFVAGDIGVQTPPTTEIEADKRDGFISRYDPSGTLVWTRRIASTVGTPNNDRANALAVDDTGIYVGGSTAGILPGQIPVAGWDGYLRKYDAAGTLVWTRQFGTSGFDNVVAVAANATGIFVLGETDSAFSESTFAGGIYDVFLRKYDAAGNLLWARQFGTDGNEFPAAAAADATGLYISGATSGRLPEQNSAPGYDAFARRYDNGGNIVWTRQFSATRDVLATGLSLDAASIYIVGNVFGTLPGQSGGGGANEDVFARKYDLNGNAIWTRQFGSDGTDVASGSALGLGGLGGLFIVGGTPRVLLSPEPDGGFRDALLTRMAPGTPTAPVVFSGAVVNGASFRGGAPVSPGSIATVFGLNLAGSSSGSLVVQMNSITAPVYAATATQINFQVPWELAGLAQAELKITIAGVASNTIQVPLAASQPAIFTANSTGAGQAVAVIANTSSLAAPAGVFAGSRPAGRGEFITIYATGLGPVSNRPPTGVPAPASPLSPITTLIAVTIGGISAPVNFAGLAPGFFGLYQINAQIPSSLRPADAVPVTVSVGGTLSNTTTIAVR